LTSLIEDMVSLHRSTCSWHLFDK